MMNRKIRPKRFRHTPSVVLPLPWDISSALFQSLLSCFILETKLPNCPSKNKVIRNAAPLIEHTPKQKMLKNNSLWRSLNLITVAVCGCGRWSTGARYSSLALPVCGLVFYVMSLSFSFVLTKSFTSFRRICFEV